MTDKDLSRIFANLSAAERRVIFAFLTPAKDFDPSKCVLTQSVDRTLPPQKQPN